MKILIRIISILIFLFGILSIFIEDDAVATSGETYTPLFDITMSFVCILSGALSFYFAKYKHKFKMIVGGFITIVGVAMIVMAIDEYLQEIEDFYICIFIALFLLIPGVMLLIKGKKLESRKYS